MTLSVNWNVAVSKLFADTNFLLDCASLDRPRHVAAMKLQRMVALGFFDLAVSASSLTDVYYILRPDYSDEERRTFLRLVMRSYEVVPISVETCSMALESDEPDFEDGVLRAAAERWNADYIVSSDRSAFANSGIPRIEPDELLA